MELQTVLEEMFEVRNFNTFCQIHTNTYGKSKNCFLHTHVFNGCLFRIYLYRTILLLKFHSFILFLQIGDILCQAMHFYSSKNRLTLKLNKSYRVWWNIRISFSRRQPQYFILFSLNTSEWELCEHIFIQKYAAFVLTVTGLSFSTWLVISNQKKKLFHFIALVTTTFFQSNRTELKWTAWI